MRTKYQMIVIQSTKQIITLKYQALRQKITTSDYNKFTKEVLDAKVKEKKLLDKSDILIS